jgi:hypothetical protein
MVRGLCDGKRVTGLHSTHKHSKLSILQISSVDHYHESILASREIKWPWTVLANLPYKQCALNYRVKCQVLLCCR